MNTIRLVLSSLMLSQVVPAWAGRDLVSFPKDYAYGEAIAHLALYVGWPSAFSALPVAKDVLENRPK